MDDACQQVSGQASPRTGRGGTIPPPEHRWKPGQSGNPRGVPKGKTVTSVTHKLLHTKALAAGGVFVEMAEKMGLSPKKATVLDLFARRAVLNAMGGNGTALAQILDRLEGKPAQEIVVDGRITAIRQYLAEMDALTCPPPPVTIDVTPQPPALPAPDTNTASVADATPPA